MPIILPESRFIIFWEIYLLIITVGVTILAPLIVVFDLSLTLNLQIIDFIVTVTFAFDIIIHLNTAFMVKQDLIKDKSLIRTQYLKSWFFWDLLATLPFSWLTLFSRFAVLNRAFRFFRLARIIKILSSSKTLNRIQKLSFVNPALMRLFLLVFWILIASHLITCGWIFIGGPGKYTNAELNSNGEIYLEAFYWTVTTLSTIGYGDITPDNPIEFIYVILIMLMGAALYGFIIGNIASIIANIDVAKSQFQKKMDNLNTFFKYRNIPIKLQNHIYEYYDYLWRSRRGYDESSLLQDLPKALKIQVSLFLNQDIIAKVPFFKNASRPFIRDIILNLKPIIFTPGDTIITFGEVGHEMYFISRGEVIVSNEQETITYATLGTGQYFGEMALILSTERTATVRSKGFCDLYVLDRKTFNSILRRYPLFAKEVEELAGKRRQELNLDKKDMRQEDQQ